MKHLHGAMPVRIKARSPLLIAHFYTSILDADYNYLEMTRPIYGSYARTALFLHVDNEPVSRVDFYQALIKKYYFNFHCCILVLAHFAWQNVSLFST